MARTVALSVGSAVVIVALALAVVMFVVRPEPSQPQPPPPVNSEQLRTAITAEALVAHLDALQRIADANKGNRAAGTAGYAASLDYVETRLRDAGYSTTRQQFSYQRPDFTRASLERIEPTRTEYAVSRDHRPLAFSGSGSVTAPVTAVDLNLDGDRATTSGCEASDFANFPRGTIALVQRGTCHFNEKVDHAVAAGANGVVVLNQGDDRSREGIFSGTLGRPAAVPVVATTFELGREWSRTPTMLALTVESTVATITTENLIAETPSGAVESTTVLGGHLDSVAEGAGINDNATGVAAVLETAVRFAELGVQPNHRVRFAFWGGEEDGLYGSRHYVSQLDAAARRQIARYLNLDMIGSPNPVASVYGVGEGGERWPQGSAVVRAVFTDFLTGHGVTPGQVNFRSSDHAPFLDAGIAAGGLFTGADDGADPCYHEACDRLDGIDREMLALMADAAAHAALTFAQAP